MVTRTRLETALVIGDAALSLATAKPKLSE